ncbi:MAG: hypothetical protein IKL15_02295 [Mycoplasmataceae bacterium]|nr:hypothetical protein [Mycoplasmataceae bacterium]
MATEKRTICLSCRQSGKCLSSDVKITIRNKQTLEEEEVTISEFFERIKN